MLRPSSWGRRAVLYVPHRTSYYRKYGIPRNATDEDIKKLINAYTAGNASRSAQIPGNPKSKLGLFAIMTTRDQWAKYVLLHKRKAYDIWVDEKNLAKAMATAIYSDDKPKKLKIENAKDDGVNKSQKGSAEDLNRQMAEKQKAAWGENKASFKDFHNQTEKEPKQDSGTSHDESHLPKEESVLEAKIKKEPILPKGLGVALSAGLLLSLRSPLGRRFLAPALAVVMMPIAAVLYYLFEDGRSIESSPQKNYSKESIIERRRKRLLNEKTEND